MVELNKSYPFLAPVLYHLVSGGAFFTGAGLIMLSAALSFVHSRGHIGVAIRFIAVLGACIIALSSTPFAAAVNVIGVVVLAAWLVIEERPAWGGAALVPTARGVVIALTLIAVLVEAPKHALPTIDARHNDTLYVLGDSISAEAEEGDLVWPTILARERHVKVVNLSRGGAHLGTILPEVARIQPGTCLVLLEIGGNDLLSKADPSQFEADLESLLKSVCGQGRTVVMLELPLPPFCAAYGRAQRRLAREFEVILIPKRVFAKVLAGRANTTDGLHLSARGHRRMADAVWRLIGNAMVRRDA